MPGDLPHESTPYDVLEVRADASSRDITRAYRRLARAWHPDAQPSMRARRHGSRPCRTPTSCSPTRRGGPPTTNCRPPVRQVRGRPAGRRTSGAAVRRRPARLRRPCGLSVRPQQPACVPAARRAGGTSGAAWTGADRAPARRSRGRPGRGGGAAAGPGRDRPCLPRRRSEPPVVTPSWSDMDHGLFSISVAAELAGLPPADAAAVRARGPADAVRSPGGTRRYSRNDVTRLQLICSLSNDGLNMAGICRVLELQEETLQLQAEIARLKQADRDRPR